MRAAFLTALVAAVSQARDAHLPRILKVNNESVGDVYCSPSAKGTAKYAPAGVSLWGLPLTSAVQGSRVAYSALNEALALRCLPTLVRSFFGLGNASAGSVDHDDRSAGGAAAHALSVDYRDGTPRNFSVSCEETVKFHVGGGVRVLLTGGEHSTAGVSAALESLAALARRYPAPVTGFFDRAARAGDRPLAWAVEWLRRHTAEPVH